MLDPISQWSGLDPFWIKVILGVAVFLFLRWSWKNPWGFVRVAVVVGLLGGAAYVAFEMVKSGTAAKEQLYKENEAD